MSSRSQVGDEAFRRFLRRVWREDVAPLLRDRRAAQRRRAARVGGKLAAATGLALDSVLGLKGRPFARLMTVVGSSLGAMLPDAWDWSWLHESADSQECRVVTDHVRRRAVELPDEEALALFGLTATATREQLKHAWRQLLQRWHPDKAPDERARREYQVYFLAHKVAYERLSRAYDERRLPKPTP